MTRPRGLVIEFDQDSPVTRFRTDRVRRLHGRHPRIFKLEVQLLGGDLVVTGVDPRSLPAGRYWFKKLGKNKTVARFLACEVVKNSRSGARRAPGEVSRRL